MPPNPDFFFHVPVPSPEAPAHVPVTDNGTNGLRCALQSQPSGDQFAFQAPGGRDLGKAADCCTAEITSAAPGLARRAGPSRAAPVGDDRPLGRWDTGADPGGAARPGEAAARSPDSIVAPVAADRRRTARVLAGMERVLSGVQPTDPPEMVAYWRQVHDRAAREAAAANSNHHWSRGDLLMLAEQGFPLTDAEAALCAPVSVAAALGDGWFGEGVS